MKVGSPLRALQGGQITTPYVLVLDGDDMLAVAPLDGGVMISTLEKSGADLLFCSTTQDWPPTPECKAYETKVAPACDWPFLSAGGVFGRTDEYRECCEIILANWAAGDPAVLHDGRFNDQKAWRWIHRMRYPKVKVDVERGIFGRYDATWPELAAVLNPPPPPSISVEEKRGMLEHAVVINLDRAPERLKMATEELGREGISWQRISAVDGTKAKHLRGHRAAGAYALGLTLRLLLRRALREGWPSVCIFEDDVVLADDFLKKFLACPVPEDWGLFYFGANHVHAPQVAGAGLLRVKGAYTTHGFVIHRRYFKTLLTAWSGRGSHQPPIEAVDVALQRLHKTVPTYACWPNLAWQRPGDSTIDNGYACHFDEEGCQWQRREHLDEARRSHLAIQYAAAIEAEELGEALPAPDVVPGAALLNPTPSTLSAATDRTAHEITLAGDEWQALSKNPARWWETLGEAIRVLKPGGTLAIEIPTDTPWHHSLSQPGRSDHAAVTALGIMAEDSNSTAMKRLLAVAGLVPEGDERAPWITGVKPRNEAGHIPRILHAIWVGPKKMPAHQERWMAGWQELHPDWDFHLWTDENLPPSSMPHRLTEARIYAQKADIIRADVIHQFGGVYIDTDMECFQPIDPLIAGLSGFIACERPNRPAIGIFGASPGHPLMKRWAHGIAHGAPFQNDILNETGPNFVGHILHKWRALNQVAMEIYEDQANRRCGLLYRDRYAVFDPWVFYPYWMHTRWVREDHPHCYAAHHWAHSWG